jgi:hypothetical protein
MAEKTDQKVFLNDNDIHNELLDTVKLGDEIKLNPIFYPENASFKKVEWHTTTPSVISVSQEGTLTLKKTGKATISLTTYDNLLSDAITLVVKDEVSGISELSAKIGIDVYPTLLKVGEAIHITSKYKRMENVTITIYDITGRIYKTSRFEDLTDNLKIIPDLNPGMYILSIDVSGDNENFRFVVN